MVNDTDGTYYLINQEANFMNCVNWEDLERKCLLLPSSSWILSQLNILAVTEDIILMSGAKKALLYSKNVVSSAAVIRSLYLARV